MKQGREGCRWPGKERSMRYTWHRDQIGRLLHLINFTAIGNPRRQSMEHRVKVGIWVRVFKDDSVDKVARC